MRLFSFMKRKCLSPKSSVLLLCFNPLKVFEVPEHGENPERDKEIEESYKDRESLTVEQRLELMFRKDAYGQLSPELSDVQNSTMLAALGGLIFGFSNRSFEVFNDFVEAKIVVFRKSCTKVRNRSRNEEDITSSAQICV